MVPDALDQYNEPDRSLYRDLKQVNKSIITDDEEKNKDKNHCKSACFEQLLSTSCMSGLTFDDSWSDHPSPASPSQIHGPPVLPLRGRRSLVLRMDEEQEDFPNNRFESVLQQPQQLVRQHNLLCTPPTRRASAECYILPSDTSAATWSVDLTSAYKSFDDSEVLTLETDVLEQDSANPNQGCLPLGTRTNGGGLNVLPTKTFRRLTPTLEVPEDQDHQSDCDGEEMLDEIAPPPSSTPMQVETTTAAPRRGRRTRNNKPHNTSFSRDSITLESAVIKAAFGDNSHWGVKSSISLDSALFDESVLGFVESDDDDCPSSKRTSWAVGSSLTLANFEEDSLSVIKSAGCHHDQDQDQQSFHREATFIPVESKHELICQEMNRLRFSSQGDSLCIDNLTGNEHDCRPITSTFSSITPCTKPIRTQSFPNDVDNHTAEEAS